MKFKSLLLCGLVFGITAAVVTNAATDDTTKKYVTMAQKGQADALKRALSGGSSRDHFQWLAVAYANQAQAERGSTEKREQAFEASGQYYEQWIEAIAKDSKADPTQRKFDQVQARMGYARMIMTRWAARELDALEITGGLEFDADPLRMKLGVVSDQLSAAWKTLQPMIDKKDDPEYENTYFALGIYDAITNARLDLLLTRSWADLYLGQITKADEDASARAKFLGDAESTFRDLINSGYAGYEVYQCYMGLAITHREQGKFEDALKEFESATDEGSTVGLRMQVEYERAKLFMAQHKYGEARNALKLLLAKDPKRLTDVEKQGAFFVNLARVVEANSYLIQANYYRDEARKNRSVRSSRLRQAGEARDAGLRKFRKLSSQSGAWARVARIYITNSVDTSANPNDLTPTDLLYGAQVLVEQRDYRKAIDWLTVASKHEELEKDERLAGEILFELGKTQYLKEELQAAAKTFDRLTREFTKHPNAQEACTNAFKLWAKLGKDGGNPTYYSKAADSLLFLLESFPHYPKRQEAVWDLGIVLQAAGRYDEAAREFAKIENKRSNWEEAQFRMAVCRRLDVERRSVDLSDEDYAKEADKAVAGLQTYAAGAAKRIEETKRVRLTAKMKQFAAEARISAAEVLVGPRVKRFDEGLKIAEEIEKSPAGKNLVGRVLGVRIKATLGKGDTAAASKLVDTFVKTADSGAGALLTSLAKELQEEVLRLRESKQEEAAEALARGAIGIFEQLQQRAKDDERWSAALPTIQFGLARMKFFGGQSADAIKILDALLAENPRNGSFQQLYAQALTSEVTEDSDKALINKAVLAWNALLKDPNLEENSPQLYWEAFYSRLSLALKLGEAQLVYDAITQRSIWTPELGGSPWKEKLETLQQKATEVPGVKTVDATETPEAEAEEGEQ